MQKWKRMRTHTHTLTNMQNILFTHSLTHPHLIPTKYLKPDTACASFHFIPEKDSVNLSWNQPLYWLGMLASTQSLVLHVHIKVCRPKLEIQHPKPTLSIQCFFWGHSTQWFMNETEVIHLSTADQGTQVIRWLHSVQADCGPGSLSPALGKNDLTNNTVRLWAGNKLYNFYPYTNPFTYEHSLFNFWQSCLIKHTHLHTLTKYKSTYLHS